MRRLQIQVHARPLPKYMAVTLDGNRRYIKQQGLWPTFRKGDCSRALRGDDTVGEGLAYKSGGVEAWQWSVL